VWPKCSGPCELENGEIIPDVAGRTSAQRNHRQSMPLARSYNASIVWSRADGEAGFIVRRGPDTVRGRTWRSSPTARSERQPRSRAS